VTCGHRKKMSEMKKMDSLVGVKEKGARLRAEGKR
jgi:hypothetical protein